MIPEHVATPDPQLYFEGVDDALILDFETTTIGGGSAQYGENSIVLAVWQYKGETYYCWGDEYKQSLLVEHCRRCSYIVAHNAKFELQWLERCGLDIGDKLVFCTMLAEYVLGGNLYAWGDLSLDNTAERHLGAKKIPICGMMYKSKQCSLDIPESWLLRYCKRDVDLCREVWYTQLTELDRLDLLGVCYTRCLTTTVLADIEGNGMFLDEELVKAKADELEEKYAASNRRLSELLGDINPNSGVHLAEFLYDTLGFEELTKRGKVLRTATDKRLTSADAINQLTAKTKEQRTFREAFKTHKALHNELTKYLRKFSDCCDKDGGRLRAVFNQSATRTHRLSSSGLDYSTQFQNFPRDYKCLFRSRHEGWRVGEGDGAQLEFRIAAHLGRDEVALSDIRNKVDIHSYTASIIGCTRQEAKADTFKPLYGGQSGTKKQQQYYKAFKEKYAGIASAQAEWISEVQRTGTLVTEWGMRYHWPDTKGYVGKYVPNTTSICNYPVQAFATAEIIPIALVYFWHFLRSKGMKTFVVNTIHDSIIVECPPEEEEEVAKLFRKCLIYVPDKYLKDVYDVEFVAPLGCGVKFGEHWGVGEEVVYES